MSGPKTGIAEVIGWIRDLTTIVVELASALGDGDLPRAHEILPRTLRIDLAMQASEVRRRRKP